MTLFRIIEAGLPLSQYYKISSQQFVAKKFNTKIFSYIALAKIITHDTVTTAPAKLHPPYFSRNLAQKCSGLQPDSKSLSRAEKHLRSESRRVHMTTTLPKVENFDIDERQATLAKLNRLHLGSLAKKSSYN